MNNNDLINLIREAVFPRQGNNTYLLFEDIKNELEKRTEPFGYLNKENTAGQSFYPQFVFMKDKRDEHSIPVYTAPTAPKLSDEKSLTISEFKKLLYKHSLVTRDNTDEVCRQITDDGFENLIDELHLIRKAVSDE